MSTLRVPRRFHGPPKSGNGGWTAGALAATLPHGEDDAPVTVSLRLPPPLDISMPLTPTANGTLLTHEGRTVAEARYAEAEPVPVPAVPVFEAAAAEPRYGGHHVHPFPTCFTCGPGRRPGDGLRIFPGPVPPSVSGADEPTVACTWTPYEVSTPIIWAALDCPGGWASGVDQDPAVLGTITVRIHRAPTTSDRYVLVAALRRSEGRKKFTAATLYDPRGEAIATAEHVWITVDPATFR